MDNKDNKPAKDPNKKILFASSLEAAEVLEKSGYALVDANKPLEYSPISDATGTAKKTAPTMAFTENPTPAENFLGLYKSKRRLLPDEVIKQICIQDHLVAAILRARGNMLSSAGHLRKDRFDFGIEILVKPEIAAILTPEQRERVEERVKKLEEIILNCGHNAGLEHQDRMSLSTFLDLQTRNGLRFARFGTEIIYDRSGPEKKFHRFRPVDIATIYKTVRKGEAMGNNMRAVAMKMLEALTGDKNTLNPAKFEADEYAWVQVIDNLPRQAFTHDELLVSNLYPSTDVEHNGYPLSPIDTVITSITTHISIDTYEKLYFQNGRASKGMLLIQSDEVDESIINSVKLQFNASINSVSNSFRTPIFGVGKDDTVSWVNMEGPPKDGDFQYMYDQVARNILSAFNMSPDELPGYNHLSRGSNSQTLSESNNEFKLTASRDTGLRPLIGHFQTFFNDKLLPLIDPVLAKVVVIQIDGLDAQSKEQESTRLQQDMPTHMTYDEVLQEVDKEEVGKYIGGKFPFNERYQLILDKYYNVSDVVGELLNDPSAFTDPILRFKRDPFFLQYLQLLAQVNPNAVKAYFAPRPFAMELLKMALEDSFDEEENPGDS